MASDRDRVTRRLMLGGGAGKEIVPAGGMAMPPAVGEGWGWGEVLEMDWFPGKTKQPWATAGHPQRTPIRRLRGMA